MARSCSKDVSLPATKRLFPASNSSSACVGVGNDCAKAGVGAINSIDAAVTNPAIAPPAAIWIKLRREADVDEDSACGELRLPLTGLFSASNSEAIRDL